jgi:hypothetical protein
MVFTFAGTIASFINDDWELCECLVDFHHIEDKEHEGIHAAKAFVQIAATRGGLNKISSELYRVFACPDCTNTFSQSALTMHRHVIHSPVQLANFFKIVTVFNFMKAMHEFGAWHMSSTLLFKLC